jgi:hypothetical protein
MYDTRTYHGFALFMIFTACRGPVVGRLLYSMEYGDEQIC